MIGYLICLDSVWQGIRHVLIVARDEVDMLEQFHRAPYAELADNRRRSRITWVATTPADWDLWERRFLKELCQRCSGGNP